MAVEEKEQQERLRWGGWGKCKIIQNHKANTHSGHRRGDLFCLIGKSKESWKLPSQKNILEHASTCMACMLLQRILINAWTRLQVDKSGYLHDRLPVFPLLRVCPCLQCGEGCSEKLHMFIFNKGGTTQKLMQAPRQTGPAVSCNKNPPPFPSLIKHHTNTRKIPTSYKDVGPQKVPVFCVCTVPSGLTVLLMPSWNRDWTLTSITYALHKHAPNQKIKTESQRRPWCCGLRQTQQINLFLQLVPF